MLPVVVLAGGLGTRLHAVTGEKRPKALALVCGRPFIDFKLASLRQAGVADVHMLIGEHGDQIEHHVGDGSQYGLRIQCHYDGPQLLGTGGAIVSALPDLPDTFWITYGDTLLDFDLQAAEGHFRARPSLHGLMTILRNESRWQPSNVRADADLVTAYEENARDCVFIDYGMIAVRAVAFRGVQTDRPMGLAFVFRHLIDERQLGAFEVFERFHEIGTPSGLREAERYVQSRFERFGISPREGENLAVRDLRDRDE